MSVKRNVIANFLGQGWTALMGLAFIPIYIHYLGIEAWGLVGFMTMLQAWLQLLDMGLSPTLSREMARFNAGAHSAQSIRNLLRSLEFIYSAVAVIVVLLIWFAASLIANDWLSAQKLSPDVLAQAITMMGLVLAGRMLEQIYRGAIQGLQEQIWLNGIQSLLATLRWAGAAFVLAFVSNTIQAFFVWQVIVSLISVFVLISKTYSLLPQAPQSGKFDFSAILEIRNFAAGMALTTLLSILLMQVDKLLLSKLVSLEEFGYYMLAGSLAGALYFLMTPIVIALSPRLTELVVQSNEDLIARTYHEASQWLSALLIPAALMMSVFSEPILYAWTGNLTLSKHSAPLLTLLSLGTLCNGFMHIPYTTQLAYGWTSFAFRVNLIAVVIIIPLILWVVPVYGAIGAAWIWFILNASYVLFGIHFMHTRILPNQKWYWYRYTVFIPLSVGVLSALLLHSLIPLPENRALLTFLIVVIGGIVLNNVLWVTAASRSFLIAKFKSYKESFLNV